MGMNDLVHPDFRHKETSTITDPSVNFDYAVQPYNARAMNTLPTASNQMLRTVNNGRENLYNSFVFQSEMEKHYAEDVSRAEREYNQETYFDAGFFLAKGYKDHLGHITCTPLTNNSFEIIARIRVCGEEFALFKFKKANQGIIPANECEAWFSLEEFMCDQDTENFIVKHLQIVNAKALKKEATKSIRNIIYCKLMSAPLKDYAQFGWNNANNANFYFDGLDIANTRGFPAYWISPKSKKQMEISAAVQCLQKALESNPYLQDELACAFLISMVSIVLSFVRDTSDKVPVVVLYSSSAKSFQNIEAIFKYNANIPSTNNEEICSNSALRVRYIADDALIIDVVSHKNASMIIQISQGGFWGDTKLKTPVYLVKHDFNDVSLSYDWALDFDDLVVEPSVGIALGRLKHEIIMQIEQKRISIDGLRTVGGDLFSFCESFLSWIGTENVYDELTGPLLKILTTGSKALEEFDGVNLIADILKQKLKFFTKTSTSASYIEKDREYYIPTALFDEICEMLSLKPLAAKKALRLRGGLRVYNSTRLEYTMDITDPVSRKRVKAVAITKSFLLGGEKSE